MGRNFDQSTLGWQVGFDKSHEVSSGKLHTGVMINYLDSNPSYHSGSGKLYSTGVGVYGSWIGNNNHYVDLAIRGSNLHNDYSLLDNSGTQVSGKYDAWAYGVSAEYGYRAKLKNNWTIEPQVELSLGHIGSGNHTTSSGLEVSQSSINTSVGRIGILFGKDFGSENKKGNAYFKASWIHDFSGDGTLTGAFQGDQANLKTAQHQGSGLELNVGTNLKINNKVDTYFELSKTFGAPVDTNWQINGGIRINW
jgi:outer membrane autotransporter protein